MGNDIKDLIKSVDIVAKKTDDLTKSVEIIAQTTVKILETMVTKKDLENFATKKDLEFFKLETNTHFTKIETDLKSFKNDTTKNFSEVNEKLDDLFDTVTSFDKRIEVLEV